MKGIEIDCIWSNIENVAVFRLASVGKRMPLIMLRLMLLITRKCPMISGVLTPARNTNEDKTRDLLLSPWEIIADPGWDHEKLSGLHI